MKNNIDNLFKKLENTFDVSEPESEHQQRFLDRLNGEKQDVIVAKNKTSYWKPLFGIAAAVSLIVTLTFNNTNVNEDRDLASVSPELAETQNFFSNTIAFELNKLNAEQTPETKALIDDALFRLNKLETEYQNLKLNLIESGEDQRVIYAMITNFQNRIDLLQNTLLQIEDLKQLKDNNYETTI